MGLFKKTKLDYDAKIVQLRAEIRDVEAQLSKNRAMHDTAYEKLKLPKSSFSRNKNLERARHDLGKDKNKLEKELAHLKAKLAQLESKKQYADYKGESVENGGQIMFTYTDEDIDAARLKVYESVRAGRISEEEKDEILYHLSEAVDDYNRRIDELCATESDDDDEDDDECGSEMDVKSLKKKLDDLCENGDLTEDEVNFIKDAL